MAEFQPKGHGGPKIPAGHGGPKVSPTNLDFGTQTQGDTTPKNLPLVISNKGSQKLNWSAGIIGNRNWLTLSVMSGQVAANSQETITAKAQTGSLAVGNYMVDLTFALTEGNAQVNELVTATVTITS
jgi:Viral BACON domain